MTILVVGSSGATGQILVARLLAEGHNVKAIVRRAEGMPDALRNHPRLTLITASVLDITEAQLAAMVQGCDGVASCLGHNLSFKGMFGPPHRLVTQATSRLCKAIKMNNPQQPVRYVLMNTTGNRNRDLNEPISLSQKIVIFLLRWLLPPHADNENAADWLRVQVGQNDSAVEWAAVRPDNLVNEENVTEYDLHLSPVRSAIFDSGTTSRTNVAHFMAELLTNSGVWDQWKGKMPVIYNRHQT